MRVKSTLKDVMDRRKLSIRKCAEICGLNPETVRRMYNDTTMQYQRDSLGKLCKGLEVELTDILVLEKEDGEQ